MPAQETVATCWKLASSGVRAAVRSSSQPVFCRLSMASEAIELQNADVVKQDITSDYQLEVGSLSLSVRSISSKLAKPFLAKYHYSHSCPAGQQFGFFAEGHLVGVATIKGLSGGSWNGSRYTRFAKENGFIVKELSRLALVDVMPDNSESYFIGRLIRLVRQLGCDVLLSYADPTYGHAGTIYRATNWLYYGLSTGHADKRGSFIVNGQVVSQSSLRRYPNATGPIQQEAALREQFG